MAGIFDVNCKLYLEKGKLMVYATVDIDPGMELFISYSDDNSYFVSHGEKKNSKKECLEYYGNTLEKSSLALYLRESSSKLPAVTRWVEWAQKVIMTSKKEKSVRNKLEYQQRLAKFQK